MTAKEEKDVDFNDTYWQAGIDKVKTERDLQIDSIIKEWTLVQKEKLFLMLKMDLDYKG